jgi:hypothetical protein
MASVIISGDTSGSVTITAPAVAGTPTLTLPTTTGTILTTASTAVVTQAMLSTNVVGNGPAFSAYLSSNQSITTGTLTKMQCNTEEFDTASAYDNATNYRFTPQVAGYYQVSGGAQLNYTSGSLSSFICIYKNGSAFKFGNNTMNTNVYQQVCVSALIYLNGSTDYVEMYAQQNSGGSANIGGNQNTSYFQAVLVRAA